MLAHRVETMSLLLRNTGAEMVRENTSVYARNSLPVLMEMRCDPEVLVE